MIFNFNGKTEPEWYRNLPETVKPIKKEIIDEIELFREKQGSILSSIQSHQMIFMGIMTSRWAVKKIQKWKLGDGKKRWPNDSEKELWKKIILSRLGIKSHSLGSSQDPSSKPLTQNQIEERISNINQIIAECNSFDDIIDYILKIDEEENRFYDPSGLQAELENILEHSF